MLDSNTQRLNEMYPSNSLNFYSLLNFKNILKPLILHSNIQSICEIGIEKSHLTTWLASLSHVKNFYYSGVDPVVNSIPKFSGENKFFKENSLTYLNRPEAAHDLFLINSGHNYNTIYHELQSIFLKKNPKQSICFLHDVLPHWGNRDLYYNPRNIPENFLYPFTRIKALNSNFEICKYNHKSCAEFFWAIESGNPKNGVSTAIKDFLANYKKELALHYFTIPLFYGLGLLYSKKLINPSIQKFLLKKNIYYLLANKNIFQPLENNRIKLYINLISEQKIKSTKIKEIESSARVYTLNALLIRYLKKIYRYIYLKKTMTSKKASITSLNEILLHCSESKVISFDFFDTLVHRIITPPDRVNLKTAEYAAIKLKQLGYYVTAEKFNQIRSREETKLRDNNFYKKGKDRETDIFSIIERTLLHITKQKLTILIVKIIEYEIINEINHLYLNSETKKIIKELKNKGKKIILCSDMYLSAEHIKQIADNFGILSYIDKFYVSSTKKITKGSGRLFKFILHDLNLPPKKMLHIGDNFISDYHSPRKLGIKALYYHNKSVLKNYKKINQALEQINTTKKAINKKFIDNFICLKNYKDDYQEISQHISPVLSLFAYQTLLDIHAKGIKKVFFFAREGILLKKIFKEILDNVLYFQSEKDTFKLEIIYISRLSSSSAIYQGIKDIDLLIGTTKCAAGSLSIKNLLNTYGLSTNDFSETTFKKIEPYFYYSDKNSLITLLTHTPFGKEFTQILTNKRNLLEQYLLEQGVLSKGKIGLVDLGWGGTIQKNISHFLPDHPSTEFFGYYFGTNHLIFNKNALAWNRSTFFPGYIISYQNDYKAGKFNAAIPFIESICGCDAIGTTIGYKLNTDGTIAPLLENNSKKNSYNLHFQKIITDKLRYDVKEFSQLFNIASIPIEKLKNYSTQQFLKFIFKPKHINLKKIQAFKFNYNWSLNLESPLITPIKFSDIFKPVELLKKIRSSPWRYGTIATAPIPFLLSMYNIGYYCFNYLPKIKNKIQKFLRYTLRTWKCAIAFPSASSRDEDF